MATTSQPATFQELYLDLENRVRVNTGVTATEDVAKRYINIALKDMHIGSGEIFWWAHRDEVLRVRAEYTTGTVTATQGSTTLSGTSTVWTTADAFSVNNMRAGGK